MPLLRFLFQARIRYRTLFEQHNPWFRQGPWMPDLEGDEPPILAFAIRPDRVSAGWVVNEAPAKFSGLFRWLVGRESTPCHKALRLAKHDRRRRDRFPLWPASLAPDRGYLS